MLVDPQVFDRSCARPPFPTSRATSTRVLVAGLNQVALMPVVHALRRAGYEVVSARSAVRLLTQIRRAGTTPDEPIDVLVVDGSHQSATSAALLEKVRETHWELPIVLVASADDTDLSETARRLGVDARLDAPFEVDDVVAAVSRLAPPIFDVAS